MPETSELRTVQRNERYERWLDRTEPLVEKWMTMAEAEGADDPVKLTALNSALMILGRLIELRIKLQDRKRNERSEMAEKIEAHNKEFMERMEKQWAREEDGAEQISGSS